jgi:hypothetical protein
VEVEGSPARALKVSPSFDGYYFIDLKRRRTDHLKRLCGDRQGVHIYTRDATSHLLTDVLPAIIFENYKRALAFPCN